MFGFLEVALHLVLLCNVLVGIIQELLGYLRGQVKPISYFLSSGRSLRYLDTKRNICSYSSRFLYLNCDKLCLKAFER